jgi:protein-S-isoprenylcysteine O-methyltransferase Ste14
MNAWERWLLLAFFVLHFLIAFAWRSWRTWRATGVNPYVLPAGDDVGGFVGRAFRGLMLAMAAYLILQAVAPQAAQRFGRLAWLEHATVRASGWSILLLSLGWLAVAQANMERSWRIGIDLARGTELVTTGLFAVFRNPIFLGMRVNLLGLFLLRPDAVTLALGLVGEMAMQTQVRLEEAHLSGRHGERYERYRCRVRRWL